MSPFMQNQSIHGIKMAEIRRGLERNIDVTIYVKSEYDEYQMKEIRRGLEENLDVSAYAKPKYTRDQMAEIRQV